MEGILLSVRLRSNWTLTRSVDVFQLYNEPSLIYELGSFDPEEVEILLEAYLKVSKLSSSRVGGPLVGT